MGGGKKAMSKGAMTKTLATQHELKQKACSEVINSLVAIATAEVKKNGVFTIPGLCRLKTRTKPATKAGVRIMFGKETKVKAKPAKTIVKAYPVHALISRSKWLLHIFFLTLFQRYVPVGIPWNCLVSVVAVR